MSVNNLKNVSLFKLGVAGTSDDRSFSFAEDKSIISSMVFDSGDNTLIIPCTTLENILTTNNLPVIDLLKLDCEGAEFEILYQSHNSTLARITNIKMEYHNNPLEATQNITALTEFLTARGFTQTLYKPANQNIGIAWFKNNSK